MAKVHQFFVFCSAHWLIISTALSFIILYFYSDLQWRLGLYARCISCWQSVNCNSLHCLPKRHPNSSTVERSCETQRRELLFSDTHCSPNWGHFGGNRRRNQITYHYNGKPFCFYPHNFPKCHNSQRLQPKTKYKKSKDRTLVTSWSGYFRLLPRSTRD